MCFARLGAPLLDGQYPDLLVVASGAGGSDGVQRSFDIVVHAAGRRISGELLRTLAGHIVSTLHRAGAAGVGRYAAAALRQTALVFG